VIRCGVSTELLFTEAFAGFGLCHALRSQRPAHCIVPQLHMHAAPCRVCSGAGLWKPAERGGCLKRPAVGPSSPVLAWLYKAAASPPNELSAACRRSGETLDHGGAAAAAAAALRGGGPLREVVPLQVGAQQDALRVAQVLVPCSASAGIMASAQAVIWVIEKWSVARKGAPGAPQQRCRCCDSCAAQRRGRH